MKKSTKTLNKMSQNKKKSTIHNPENLTEEEEIEGLQNFSNKLAEDILKKTQEADETAKYNPEQEDDVEQVFA